MVRIHSEKSIAPVAECFSLHYITLFFFNLNKEIHMIHLCGDIHGEIEINKLSIENYPEQLNFQPTDILY